MVKPGDIQVINGKRMEFIGGKWVESIKVCSLCSSRNPWENNRCQVCGKTEGMVR